MAAKRSAGRRSGMTARLSRPAVRHRLERSRFPSADRRQCPRLLRSPQKKPCRVSRSGLCRVRTLPAWRRMLSVVLRAQRGSTDGPTTVSDCQGIRQRHGRRWRRACRGPVRSGTLGNSPVESCLPPLPVSPRRQHPCRSPSRDVRSGTGTSVSQPTKEVCAPSSGWSRPDRPASPNVIVKPSRGSATRAPDFFSNRRDETPPGAVYAV